MHGTAAELDAKEYSFATSVFADTNVQKDGHRYKRVCTCEESSSYMIRSKNVTKIAAIPSPPTDVASSMKTIEDSALLINLRRMSTES